MFKNLTLNNFAQKFGVKTEDMPDDCRKLISKTNFSYRELKEDERDQVILDIFKKIESGELSVAGKKKQGRWRKGWQEILKDFIDSNYNIAKLSPQYMKPAHFIRLNQDYVMPKDSMFEFKWLNVFRIWFFKKYLKDVDNIYEFGCGTGCNLVALANLFPKKKLYGLDWVKAPLNIIKLLAKRYNYNIEGHLFNIFSPDESLNFPQNSAVLTFDALEQIGPNYERFLNFLLKKAPTLCLNVEPITELYDEYNLVDYLAIKFQKKRNYLEGYLNRLNELEDEGKIEIIKIKKVSFGGLYHDPYSYIVWKPKIYKKNSSIKKL